MTGEGSVAHCRQWKVHRVFDPTTERMTAMTDERRRRIYALFEAGYLDGNQATVELLRLGYAERRAQRQADSEIYPQS